MLTAIQHARAEGEGRGEARAVRWTKARAEEHGRHEYQRGWEEAREGAWIGAAAIGLVGVLVGIAAGVALF